MTLLSFFSFMRSEKLKVVLVLINMSFCWTYFVNWWFSVYSENCCFALDYYVTSPSFQWFYLYSFRAGKIEYGNNDNYRYTLGIEFKEQILLTILENKMFLCRY